MTDVLIVLYCVCCVTIMVMCSTSVVYMVRDMLVDSRAVEPVDDGKDTAEVSGDDDNVAAEKPVDDGENVTDDA